MKAELRLTNSPRLKAQPIAGSGQVLVDIPVLIEPERLERLVKRADARELGPDRVLRVGIPRFLGSLHGCDIVVDPSLQPGEMVLEVQQTVELREEEGPSR